jgi:hypothetical protein
MPTNGEWKMKLPSMLEDRLSMAMLALYCLIAAIMILISTIITSHGEPLSRTAAANLLPITKVCRGVLTANWTETSADFGPDDGSRLIRAVNINDSCLFDSDSSAGKKS